MLYSQVIPYLESFANFEQVNSYPYKKALKLERIRKFLALLGNPQDYFKSIHIAGTKGKGSTSAFISYILKEAGYRVGLYTSPHLTDLRERIRILPGGKKDEFEGMIPRAALNNLVEKLKPKIEEYNLKSQYGPLTFFEVYTALALVYFKERKVDFAVLETGLGGRLDATNAVNAIISVITPISFEHMDKLGHSLRSIAREKAGIIKNKNSIVVSAPQEKEAGDVIRARCKLFQAKIIEPGSYKHLKIKLLGRHQLENAAVAKSVIKALSAYKINIGNDSIRRGLLNTIWPGRCEVLSRNPYVIIDGAQNTASARALKETISSNFTAYKKYKKLILILGVSNDKDIRGICRELFDLADKVILTKAQSIRAIDPCLLAGYFQGKESYITNGVSEAKSLGMRLASGKDLILVTGSLFVIGEFKYGERKFN
jgi:dihydrofolate synthase/folylpolyglutamate synthase